MVEAAPRKDWWKLALIAVVAIELVGGLSGYISNSGYGNNWFDTLKKPTFMPPGLGRTRLAWSTMAVASQSTRRSISRIASSCSVLLPGLVAVRLIARPLLCSRDAAAPHPTADHAGSR